MPITIDRIDRQLLMELETDSSLTNLELADRVGLSPTPCQRRVKRLLAQGIIRNYGAIIDKKKIGLSLTCFTRVTISPHRQEQADQFAEFVRSRHEICSCHILSGSTDYLLEIVAADMEDYIHFLKTQLMELSCVANVETSFSLECVKAGSSVSALIKS